MTLDRRTVILGIGAVMATAGTFGLARALGLEGNLLVGSAMAQSPEALAQAGPLGERSLGDPQAPVTIIEYASMTCGHCATFATQTFPQLKAEYIDTGKVHFILREFPLDPVATAAFMLGRCVDEEKYFPFIDALFETQRSWAYGNDPEAGLFAVARQAGFTREKFEQCLTNQEILDGVNWVKQRAADEFEVRSTPTFFINGEVARGALSFEAIQEIIEKQLAA